MAVEPPRSLNAGVDRSYGVHNSTKSRGLRISHVVPIIHDGLQVAEVWIADMAGWTWVPLRHAGITAEDLVENCSGFLEHPGEPESC